MASPLVGTSLAYTVSFPVGGFTAEIVDVQPPNVTVGDVPTSHQGTTGFMTWTPELLRDSGEMVLEVHFNPDDDPEDHVGVVETAIVLTHPSGATWTFGGYIKEATPASHTLLSKMMSTITVKVSGDITVVAAV